jgi:hypothetical protein
MAGAGGVAEARGRLGESGLLEILVIAVTRQAAATPAATAMISGRLGTTEACRLITAP